VYVHTVCENIINFVDYLYTHIHTHISAYMYMYVWEVHTLRLFLCTFDQMGEISVTYKLYVLYAVCVVGQLRGQRQRYLQWNLAFTTYIPEIINFGLGGVHV